VSHSANHTDTGHTSAFYQGRDAGIRQERERIIELLEPLAQHSELCESGCYPEDCSAFAYEYAIGLIKGEQK
jgi:hypothetical protein